MDTTMNGKEHCISVRELSKRYRTWRRGESFRESLHALFKREQVIVNAVKGVSFDVEEGTILGLLGPNGAGKSTTIKMLAGTLYPSSGSINVLGFDPARHRSRYVAHIGAVFGQKSQLVWDIPPADSFRMNQAIYGIGEADYKRRLNELVELFELGPLVKTPTRVLSLGERMKCEFVMAMLHSPRVVFLDEPTIGLDIIAKQRIRGFIAEMNKRGTSFILTTHDLEDVEKLAQKVVIINHGEKVFDGGLEDLRRRLGDKKIIRLTLARPEPDFHVPHASIIERENELELTLEADVSACSIATHLRNIGNACTFTDISVKELPMETVIASIYGEEKKNL